MELNNQLENAVENTLRGLWTINDHLPMGGITLVCVVVAAIFVTFVVIWGTKKQRGNMLIMAFGLAIFCICICYGMILSLNDSIYIPVTPAPTEAPVPTSVPHTLPTQTPTVNPIPTETPTPTQIPMPTAIPAREITPTPTPINTYLDDFLKKDYSKTYKLISIFKPEGKMWDKDVTLEVFVANKTSATASIRISDYSLEKDTLNIHTLKNMYNVPSIPMGEHIYTYENYQRYTDTMWENMIRMPTESFVRMLHSPSMHAFATRGYKLTVYEGRRRARKKIVQDFISEDILSDIKNIIIDEVYFKKEGVTINVTQKQIENLFNVGNDSQIDPPTPTEIINVFLAGEADYNVNVEIFDDIKRYRQDKGLDPETGVNGIW